MEAGDDEHDEGTCSHETSGASHRMPGLSWGASVSLPVVSEELTCHLSHVGAGKCESMCTRVVN